MKLRGILKSLREPPNARLRLSTKAGMTIVILVGKVVKTMMEMEVGKARARERARGSKGLESVSCATI